MTFYMAKPQKSTKHVLELISEFSKVTRFKVKTQKLIVFLCSSSAYYNSNFKITIQNSIKMKHFELNLKNIDLYAEIYKTD